MENGEDIEVLSCTVNAVIYSNEENGYAVLSVTDTDGEKQTITGTLPFAWAGESMTAYGRWNMHGSYGRQFAVESAERGDPVDKRRIFSFLASGAVKGIGPVLAGQIVETFGENALQILEEQPEKLSRIKGISLEKARKLSAEYGRQAKLKKLVLFLSTCGIEPEYAIRLHHICGEDALEQLQENPYLLTGDGIGAPFGTADRLAERIGIEEKDPNRIRAGFRFELQYNERNGHCFIPAEKLLAAVAELLQLEPDEVSPILHDMTDDQTLARETIAGQDACYLPDMYRAECDTAERIARLVRQPVSKVRNLEKMVEEIESEQGICFAEQQRDILREAAENRILAVTGGPGTGKTTSLRGVLSLFDRMGLKTLLTAPTGRAARRMVEMTGHDAATIHRLLGARMSDTGMQVVFSKNHDEPLSCDALIVDECSMVDIRLMAALLDALPVRARLILVGDASQLPSVGPGDVFSAVLRSEAVPAVRLTEIFRQQDGSRIVRNAHMINLGRHPDFAENTGDFFRLRRLQAPAAAETVVELFSVRLPQKMQIPPEDIQVLSPSRKGTCGTVELNRLLQEKLNPPAPEKPEKLSGSTVFRVGDRLIQTRNDYDVYWETAEGDNGLGVFNGETGTLTEISTEERTLTVDFDGRRAKYDFESLSDLEHAWALTVHKAQGCEYRAVILALADAPRPLQTRTVLYTAVSRARDLLILVGSEQMAFQMIDNEATTHRFNALRIRIREACGI